MDKSAKIFKNRRATLKKKAGELASLCNVEVCVICFGPNGDLEVWPEDPTKAQSVISKYKEASKKGNKRKRKEKLDLSDILETEIKNLEKRVVVEGETDWDNSGNGVGGFSTWDEQLDALSENSLMDLSVCLDAKIQSLSQKIASVEGKQTLPTNDSFMC